MSRFSRSTQRRARRFLKKLRNAPKAVNAEGELVPETLASHVAQLASIRVMEIPPAKAGAADDPRDHIYDPDYEKKRNARKRARRARRSA